MDRIIYCFELYELWIHPSRLCTSFCPRAFNKPIVAQKVLARTFELRCRNFPVFTLLYFSLPCLGFQARSAAVFGVLSLASLPFLAFVIRRLLYVPDYVVGWLNSSYIWSLSLLLAEYNCQHHLSRILLIAWRKFTLLPSTCSNLPRSNFHDENSAGGGTWPMFG